MPTVPLPDPQPPTSDLSPLHPLSLNQRPSQTFPPHESKPTFPCPSHAPLPVPFCTRNPHSLHAVSTHPTQGRTPKVLSCCNHRQAEVPDKCTKAPYRQTQLPIITTNYGCTSHTQGQPSTIQDFRTNTPSTAQRVLPPQSPQSHHQVKARHQCIRTHKRKPLASVMTPHTSSCKATGLEDTCNKNKKYYHV